MLMIDKLSIEDPNPLLPCLAHIVHPFQPPTYTSIRSRHPSHFSALFPCFSDATTGCQGSKAATSIIASGLFSSRLIAEGSWSLQIARSLGLFPLRTCPIKSRKPGTNSSRTSKGSNMASSMCFGETAFPFTLLAVWFQPLS